MSKTADIIKDSRAYKYAKWVVESGGSRVGRYVKLQCKQWLDIAEGRASDAVISEKQWKKITKLLKIINHPDLGCSMYEGLENYSLLFIYAVLCTKTDEGGIYYSTGLLEIARKNFKTFTAGVIFIICMLTFPQFCRLFSVAPDLKLSSELQIAIKKIIKVSPALEKHFKAMRSEIRCLLTSIDYTPLAYSKDKLDGKLAHLYLADEVGAMDTYLGLDLSQTEDNTALAIATCYEDKVYAKVIGFLPEEKVEAKTLKEHVNYKKHIESGECFACGTSIVDYEFVERLILSLEEKYGCRIVRLGFDKWNAIATVQHLEAAENPVECVEIPQHSKVLHRPTKWLKEQILTHSFAYARNELLEINFSNARCTEDTNLNKYVNKKRSAGKVDMVVALINAVYLLQQEILEQETSFGVMY